MRSTRPAAAAMALAAALACSTWPMAVSAAMAATPPRAASSSPPSASACYNFVVGALRQRVVVHLTPQACAGLRPEEVNEAVARAIRTVVGPLPKAAARRQAVADSRYVGSLVRPASAGRAESAAAAPGSQMSTMPARLAALTAWLVAAIAGTRLLASRLSRSPRRGRAPSVPLWVAGSHAGLATAGLALWVPFVLTGSAVIGWLDVAMTWLIAGLGMATLLEDPPGQSVASTSATAATITLARGRAPVLTIALHGAFAAATMALVLIAVLSVG